MSKAKELLESMEDVVVISPRKVKNISTGLQEIIGASITGTNETEFNVLLDDMKKKRKKDNSEWKESVNGMLNNLKTLQKQLKQSISEDEDEE